MRGGGWEEGGSSGPMTTTKEKGQAKSQDFELDFEFQKSHFLS